MTRPSGYAPIDGGRFRMGSDAHYPEERPVRAVDVRPFWIGLHPVTGAQFARFVAATAYVTDAEKLGRSLVFTPPAGPVDLSNPRGWWTDMPGASWREAPDDHPVVHVSWHDARAYCAWARARLPRETEWEFAARGGLDGVPYAWGETLVPGGRHMANTWQGAFPWRNTGEDGYAGTSPVGAYPPNGFGLYDMIGNVWEWTADDYGAPGAATCCGGAVEDTTLKTIKGGSYLCSADYCQRYRPAARSSHTAGSATGHIGFRCAMDRA